MKKLYMYFLNEDGKKTIFAPKITADYLNAEEVREIMELVVALDVFEVKGRKKYTEIHSAKYIEKVTTDLF